MSFGCTVGRRDCRSRSRRRSRAFLEIPRPGRGDLRQSGARRLPAGARQCVVAAHRAQRGESSRPSECRRPGRELSRHHGSKTSGSGAAGSEGSSGTREPGQERVRREYEPRDSHPDERHPRHDKARARNDIAVRTAAVPGARQRVGRIARGHHQRHPRFLQDRSRTTRNRLGSVRRPRRDRADVEDV